MSSMSLEKKVANSGTCQHVTSFELGGWSLPVVSGGPGRSNLSDCALFIPLLPSSGRVNIPMIFEKTTIFWVNTRNKGMLDFLAAIQLD